MSLLKAAASGLRWNAIGTVGSLLFNLGYTAMMARMLAPASFGLIVTAQIAMRLLGHFAQLGIGPALIQKEVVAERDIRAAFTLSVSIGAVVLLIASIVAPWLGEFYESDELALLVIALAVAGMISNLALVSLSILRRQLSFKRIALIETTAYIVGYGGAGLTAAYHGMGALSLALAAIGQEAMILVLTFGSVRHSIRLGFPAREVKYFLGFGKRYSFIGFLEYSSMSLDSIVIGRLHGEIALGYYNRSQMLAKLPTHHLGTMLSKIVFPVISRAAGDRKKVADGFLVGWLIMGLLSAVISVVVGLSGDHLVSILLGEQWGAVVDILHIALACVPFSFLAILCGATCDAQGLLREKLWIQLSSSLVLVVSVAFLHHKGVIGIAISVLIFEVTRVMLYAIFHSLYLPLAVGDFMRASLLIILVSASVFVSGSLAAAFTEWANFGAIGSMLIEMGASGLSFILLAALLCFRLAAHPLYQKVRENIGLLKRLHDFLGRLGVKDCKRKASE